jgi:hypothetical protein
VKKCVKFKSRGMLEALREKVGSILEELKDYHVCKRDIAKIEA